ncbi:hypothetical protein ABKV19_017755 [Rosa sericea]
MAFLDYRNNTRVQKDDLLNFSCQIRRMPIEELCLQDYVMAELEKLGQKYPVALSE